VASEIGRATAGALAAVPTGLAGSAAADQVADLEIERVDVQVALAAADKVDLAEVESTCLL
jgi:hypothetical protein